MFHRKALFLRLGLVAEVTCLCALEEISALRNALYVLPNYKRRRLVDALDCLHWISAKVNRTGVLLVVIPPGPRTIHAHVDVSVVVTQISLGLQRQVGRELVVCRQHSKTKATPE